MGVLEARLLRKDTGQEEHIFFFFLNLMDSGMNIKSNFFLPLSGQQI